jgi:hypothetical protein
MILERKLSNSEPEVIGYDKEKGFYDLSQTPEGCSRPQASR